MIHKMHHMLWAVGIGHLGIVLASGTDLERKIRQTSGFERWEAGTPKISWFDYVMYIYIYT